MKGTFFDTSALGKHYREEPGTEVVDRLLLKPMTRQFISRLAVVELQSALATHVRTGQIPAERWQSLVWRFKQDIRDGKFAVLRITDFHYREAERLIRNYAGKTGLRTLDALQLAVALDLEKRNRLTAFVCADRGLLQVARQERLPLINPEK